MNGRPTGGAIAPVTVRAAAGDDVTAAASAMARAFRDKQPFLWLEPAPQARHRLVEALFLSMLRHLHRPGDGPEIALAGSAIAGCAVWSPPGAGRPPILRRLAAGWTMARAVGLRGMQSISMRGKALEDAFHAARPREPHWYLVGLGVEPESHGNGIGGALLRSGLARCDRQRMPAYLECLEELMPYYEARGFTFLRWIDIDPGTPRQAGMWRASTGSG